MKAEVKGVFVEQPPILETRVVLELTLPEAQALRKMFWFSSMENAFADAVEKMGGARPEGKLSDVGGRNPIFHGIHRAFESASPKIEPDRRSIDDPGYKTRTF